MNVGGKVGLVMGLHKPGHIDANAVEPIERPVAHDKRLCRQLVGQVRLGIAHPALQGGQEMVGIGAGEAFDLPLPSPSRRERGRMPVGPEQPPLDVEPDEARAGSRSAADRSHPKGATEPSHHHAGIEDVMGSEVGPAHPVNEVDGAVEGARGQLMGDKDVLAVLEQNGLLLELGVVVDPIGVAVAGVGFDEHQPPRAGKSPGHGHNCQQARPSAVTARSIRPGCVAGMGRIARLAPKT